MARSLGGHETVSMLVSWLHPMLVEPKIVNTLSVFNVMGRAKNGILGPAGCADPVEPVGLSDLRGDSARLCPASGGGGSTS